MDPPPRRRRDFLPVRRFGVRQLAARALARSTRSSEPRASSQEESGNKLPHSRARAVFSLRRLFCK
jgi:hypothetical protein